jgi:hypothetical protein
LSFAVLFHTAAAHGVCWLHRAFPRSRTLPTSSAGETLSAFFRFRRSGRALRALCRAAVRTSWMTCCSHPLADALPSFRSPSWRSARSVWVGSALRATRGRSAHADFHPLMAFAVEPFSLVPYSWPSASFPPRSWHFLLSQAPSTLEFLAFFSRWHARS